MRFHLPVGTLHRLEADWILPLVASPYASPPPELLLFFFNVRWLVFSWSLLSAVVFFASYFFAPGLFLRRFLWGFLGPVLPWVNSVGLTLMPYNSALAFVIVAPFLEPTDFAAHRSKAVSGSQLHPRRLMQASASSACQLSGGVVLDFDCSLGLGFVRVFTKLLLPEFSLPLYGGTSSNATFLE